MESSTLPQDTDDVVSVCTSVCMWEMGVDGGKDKGTVRPTRSRNST